VLLSLIRIPSTLSEPYTTELQNIFVGNLLDIKNQSRLEDVDAVEE
jgi:hypothetical protein